MRKKLPVSDRLFDGCVSLLNFLAIKSNMTYKQINVLIFVIVWPLVTIGLILLVFLK
jgi:hypothetical protein